MKRKCVICKKRTENWQRVNGSSWYCYDGCYSTTGMDRRTIDGTPRWEGGKPWPHLVRAEEEAGTTCLGPI